MPEENAKNLTTQGRPAVEMPTGGPVATAEQLIPMIQSVKIDDQDQLNLIDALFLCYHQNWQYVDHEALMPEDVFGKKRSITKGVPDLIKVAHNTGKFWFGGYPSRSRDALMTTRPKGWEFSIGPNQGGGFMAVMDGSKRGCLIATGIAATEALAEQAAIVAAINMIRKKSNANAKKEQS